MDDKRPESQTDEMPGTSTPDELRHFWIDRDEAARLRTPQEEPQEEREQSSEGLAGLVHSVAEPIVEHVVAPMVGALGTVIGAADQAWSGRDGIVERRLRRRAKEPLANLYELYPEARLASPRELGLRFVPLEEIRGTAVAGAAQRGGDFLPLKPFRGQNWAARWRRIQAANDRLVALPPVDLVKYDGDFWVVDGHNRVAVSLYANGAGLDAMVTELVALDGRTSEAPSQLLGYLSEAGELRAAAQGHRPAMGMRMADQAREEGGELSRPDSADGPHEARETSEASEAAKTDEKGT